MKRKSTIRKMRGMPVSRDIYRTINQAQAMLKRLERLAEQVERLELDSAALNVARRTRLPGIETAVRMSEIQWQEEESDRTGAQE